MKVEKLTVGELQVNCYICTNEITKVGFVVDPGDNSERICDFIKRNGYKITHIVLTHGHFDHIMALYQVKEFTGAKIVISEYDVSLLKDDRLNLSAFMGNRERKYVKEDIVVKDGEKLETVDFCLEFVLTPGHTDGSMCIITDDIMFSGDMIFKNSIGRTDFPPYGSPEKMRESVKKLKALDKNYRIYPGHGPETTLGEEKRTNPYFAEDLWNLY